MTEYSEQIANAIADIESLRREHTEAVERKKQLEIELDNLTEEIEEFPEAFQELKERLENLVDQFFEEQQISESKEEPQPSYHYPDPFRYRF